MKLTEKQKQTLINSQASLMKVADDLYYMDPVLSDLIVNAAGEIPCPDDFDCTNCDHEECDGCDGSERA